MDACFGTSVQPTAEASAVSARPSPVLHSALTGKAAWPHGFPSENAWASRMAIEWPNGGAKQHGPQGSVPHPHPHQRKAWLHRWPCVCSSGHYHPEDYTTPMAKRLRGCISCSFFVYNVPAPIRVIWKIFWKNTPFYFPPFSALWDSQSRQQMTLEGDPVQTPKVPP